MANRPESSRNAGKDEWLIEDSRSLEGRCLLVVEDEYMIAIDLVSFLESLGAEVVGPAGSVAEGLGLVEHHGRDLDVALLDINLRGERVYPVADALAARGVPMVFTTGYDALVLPAPYQDAPRCDKPISKRALVQLLSRMASARGVDGRTGGAPPTQSPRG